MAKTEIESKFFSLLLVAMGIMWPIKSLISSQYLARPTKSPSLIFTDIICSLLYFAFLLSPQNRNFFFGGNWKELCMNGGSNDCYGMKQMDK